MTERPVQMFTDEYLDTCKSMTADQTCRFIEDFRRMVFEARSLSPSRSSSEKPDAASEHASNPQGP